LEFRRVLFRSDNALSIDRDSTAAENAVGKVRSLDRNVVDLRTEVDADSQTDSSLVIGVRRAHSRSFGQATFRPIFHLDDLEAEPIVNLAVVQRLDRVVVRACDVSGSKQFFKARSEERRVGKERRSET